MPDYADQDRYRSIVAQARAETLALTRRSLRDLEAEYARLLAALVEEVTRNPSEAARGSLMRRSASVQEALRRIVARILALETDAERAARILGDGHAAAVELAVTQARADGVRVAMSVSFESVPERAVEALLRRRQLAMGAGSGSGLNSYAELFRSVARRASSGVLAELDGVLLRGVARGADSRTVALDVARRLTEGDDALRAAVDALAPSLKRSGVTLSGGAAARAEAAGLSDSELNAARGLLSDSRRVARSEILGAQLEADRLAQHESPVVRATRWQLSGNHPPSGCECEVFARTDLYELGVGVFPTNAVPSRPHPHCGCVLVPITRGPSEWGAPKPRADRAAVVGSYPFKTRADGRAYPDGHRRRVTENANAVLRRALESDEVPA